MTVEDVVNIILDEIKQLHEDYERDYVDTEENVYGVLALRRVLERINEKKGE